MLNEKNVRLNVIERRPDPEWALAILSVSFIAFLILMQTLAPDHRFFAKDFEHFEEPVGPADSELD